MNAVTSFDLDPHFIHADSAIRRKRHRRDTERMRRSAEALMLSHRGVTSIGPHDDVDELAAEMGLERHDFCSFDVRIGTRRACLICVPNRLWHKPRAMETFRELKEIAKIHGFAVVLVSQTYIQRQPRLDNSTLIAGTATFSVSPTDRMAILARLLEQGSASVYELSELVKHSDPISTVLHLVATGCLDLDLNARITPHSLVRLSPEH